jgi:hypothetical protein
VVPLLRQAVSFGIDWILMVILVRMRYDSDYSRVLVAGFLGIIFGLDLDNGHSKILNGPAVRNPQSAIRNAAGSNQSTEVVPRHHTGKKAKFRIPGVPSAPDPGPLGNASARKYRGASGRKSEESNLFLARE